MGKTAENQKPKEITALDFVSKVIEMRDCQKNYFKTRDKGVLFESKRLENEVDKMAKHLNTPKQKSIFDEVEKSIGVCECSVEETTGWTQIKCCNICGFPVKGQMWDFNKKPIIEDLIQFVAQAGGEIEYKDVKFWGYTYLQNIGEIGGKENV